MAVVRGPFGVTLRRCLATTTLPTAAAAALALLMHWVARPSLDVGDAPGAATPWLTLPLLTAAVGCCLTAARLWPTFALRRAGADLVRRLERGPLGGRGAVVGGALLAQLVLTVPLTTGLARGLGAPAMAARHVVAEPEAEPLLLENGATLRFSLPRATTAVEIWLRPVAGLPQGPLEPTAVRLSSDGVPLTEVPPSFDASHQLLRSPIRAGQPLTTLDLTRTTGTVPLLFPRGSVIVLGPADLPGWQNGLLLCLLAVSTSLLTLVLAGLLGATSGWATVAAVIACSHFVQWIAGVGPIDDALLALLRGQWLPGTG